MSIEQNKISQSQSIIQKVKGELAQSIAGMSTVIDPLLIGLVARGHVLLEGMPGLAKTLLAKRLASCVDAKFKRVQFTPDLLPADLTGTNIFNPKTTNFEIRKGPIFTNVLLADEINRAPAKVQSALLQCMEERQVSIGDQTFTLEDPFFVMATQNPIEQDGTYPLPEAQLDRFLFKIQVPYPKEEEELRILNLHGRVGSLNETSKPVIHINELTEISETSNKVFIDEKLSQYIVRLIRNTRPEDTSDSDLKSYIKFGASPRASLSLLRVSRISAIFEGRDFVIPEDIIRFFPIIVGHRMQLSLDAITEDVQIDSILKRVLSITEVP
ncbi:MoxR-like ATPase [Leptospira ryugenii]|uniref:MoxR-like ATPase n=1 Tax=Leptospira ryugenii TaxID=1917863 RepID=A0A2P2E4W5_9LEPT|nr:MoxR family ATPase [Leptospira ryugenii]GBF51917.1 MoxR-like ATPase [Leptospira ryugenii]